jgi:hypothetical protein
LVEAKATVALDGIGVRRDQLGSRRGVEMSRMVLPYALVACLALLPENSRGECEIYINEIIFGTTADAVELYNAGSTSQRLSG